MSPYGVLLILVVLKIFETIRIKGIVSQQPKNCIVLVGHSSKYYSVTLQHFSNLL